MTQESADTPAAGRNGAGGASSASAPARLLVPDGCRLGIVLRVALSANLAVLAGAGWAAQTWPQWWRAFLEAAGMVEPAILLALLTWCLLRRALPALAPWPQRIIAALVPPLAFLVVEGLVSFAGGAGWQPPPPGMLAAALAFGAAIVHYIELHDRAHSPVLAEARFQALQSRIRPHFLFNSLNAAISIVRSDPVKAERMLESLADLVRSVMGNVRKLVPFAQELDLCRRYVEIEETRLGARLQVDWQIGAVHPHAEVPQLLLQPLIENAVRYGAEKQAGECCVVVRARQRGFNLELFVSNPIAREPLQRESNQMGLANIRGRLALIYDLDARLDTQVGGDRFEVTVTLPVEHR